MKVLAIDPGERVGYAVGEVTERGQEAFLRPVARGVSPLKDFAMKFVQEVDKYDVVVYETWRLVAGKEKHFIGSEFLPSQLIGMIRMTLWHHPGIKVVPVPPKIKQETEKSFPKYLQEYIKNSTEEHDKDAVQLLWGWFFKEVL